MSAASPKAQDKVPDLAQEPSMEEILASIRRIIADDQVAKSEEPEPARAPLPENDDILDLAEVAKPIRKAAPAPIAAEPVGRDEVAVPEPDPEPEPEFDAIWDEPLAPEPPPRQEALPRQDARYDARPEPASAGERLTSAVTDASVTQAFSMLANTVLSNNARTLEDLVQDMLRPMLKSWLDDNLPVMVERLVRAEIERVARGR